MPPIVGIRIGPQYCGMVARDGARLLDAATIARRAGEPVNAYAGRVVHRATAMRRQLDGEPVTVVEGIRPGERGARLRRQHGEQQAALEALLGKLAAAGVEPMLVPWATDTSAVPRPLRGPRPARLSPNEHPKGSREAEQAAWRATSRYLADATAAARFPALSPQVTPTVDTLGTLRPARRSPGEERDGDGGGAGLAGPAGSRPPSLAPASSSAEQAALTSAPPPAPDRWEATDNDGAVWTVEIISDDDPLGSASTVVERADLLEQALAGLDRLDRQAALLARAEARRRAEAFGAVVVRAAAREARRARPGERTRPLRVSAVAVTNRLRPWYARRVRVGYRRATVRRVVYFERLSADNRKAEQRRRLVHVVHGRAEPLALTLAAGAVLAAACLAALAVAVVRNAANLIALAALAALALARRR